MKFIIEDANILLDLANGDILAAWLSLGHLNGTTDLVWAEVKRTGQRAKIEPFIDSRQIQLCNIEPNEWSEIAAFSGKNKVSVPDGSVWFLAKKQGAILLTGDGILRKAARTDVEVRGVLWVLDELVREKRLTPLRAIEALNAIREQGAFLPESECTKRIAAWS